MYSKCFVFLTSNIFPDTTSQGLVCYLLNCCASWYKQIRMCLQWAYASWAYAAFTNLNKHKQRPGSMPHCHCSLNPKGKLMLSAYSWYSTFLVLPAPGQDCWVRKQTQEIWTCISACSEQGYSSCLMLPFPSCYLQKGAGSWSWFLYKQ